MGLRSRLRAQPHSYRDRETNMGFRIEAMILGPETAQYTGDGRSQMSASAIAEQARWVEDMGYDGVTTPETGHDPFLPLAIAAEHTARVRLGTSVAIAFPRSPLVSAQLAWDLQQLSRGRFLLGLGTQVKGHNERRYAAPWTGPAGPRMREYIACVRAMFHTFRTGEKPRFEGEHYQFTLMSPFFDPGPIEFPDPPIYVAAVNTYLARMAGELCHGLRLHPIATFRYVREVLGPEVAAGAERSGRARNDIDVVGVPFLAIGPDEASIAAAKQALKQRIAFYASTRTYHSVLELHGWQDVGARLHRLSVERKWKEMADQITDDMLEEWAIVGTYDDLVPRLRERCAGAFDSMRLELPADLRRDTDRVREIVRSLRA